MSRQHWITIALACGALASAMSGYENFSDLLSIQFFVALLLQTATVINSTFNEKPEVTNMVSRAMEVTAQKISGTTPREDA